MTVIALRALAGALFILAFHAVCAVYWPSDKIVLLLTVLIVLAIAIRWGRIPALVASITAAFSYTYFIQQPAYTFRVYSRDEYFEAATLLIVATVGSQLSLTAQRRAAEALARRIEVERLYDFGRALLSPDSSTALAGAVVEELVRTFDARASALRLDDAGLIRRAGLDADSIRIEELAADSAPSTIHGKVESSLAVIPVMNADSRLGIIATLEAAMSPLVRRSVGTITGVALERVRGRELILKLARDIQMGFLPRSLPPFAGKEMVDLFAFIKPTYDVGGDFYSALALDEKRLFFAVGDVADKGIPAALFMARTITALDISVTSNESLTEAIGAVNRTLCANNDSQMFVTVLSAVLDTETGMVEYCDSGHEPPFVVSADGTARMIEKSPGLALGFNAGYAYTTGRIALAPGDSLILYTDGINEAMNAKHELFGVERMRRALESAARDCAAGFGSVLLDAVQRFVGEAAQSDDITLLIVRYVPSPAQTFAPILTVMEPVEA